MGLKDIITNIPSRKELKGNFAENLTQLFSVLVTKEVYVLKDVLIDGHEEYTSQIDLLLVGVTGIYVVEVKFFEDAYIYGDGNKRDWYYYRGGKKYSIYSPMLQNKNHIKHLKNMLKDFGDMPCFSIIALLCKDFKVSSINKNPENPDTVILSGLSSFGEALEVISKNKPVVFTEERQKAIYDYIENHQYVDKKKKTEHIKQVQTYQEQINTSVEKCPYCKSDLVLRKGKYGEFYGCSNYPKCSYTKNK